MSDERIENLESNMQFPPSMLPKIVLRRVEEEFPIWREMVVSAMCRCADQIIILSYFEDLYGSNNKMFSSNPVTFHFRWSHVLSMTLFPWG